MNLAKIVMESIERQCVNVIRDLLGKTQRQARESAVQDVASRLTSRVQLTTDGHRPYLEAVEDAFGADIDYAQLVKIYGSEQMK